MIRTFPGYKILSRVFPIALLLLTNCKPGLDTSSGEKPVYPVPFLEQVSIDGFPGEWPQPHPAIRIFSDVYGNIPDSADLSAGFSLAWNRTGLFILAEICDDSIFEDHSRYWNGDGMELFVSPTRGSFDIVQFSVRPALDMHDSLARVMPYDHRRTDTLKAILPISSFSSQKTSSGYRIEGMIPLDALGIKEPVAGLVPAIQVYINDSDMKMDSTGHSLPWYPVRESYMNPYAFYPVQFSVSSPAAGSKEIRAFVKNDHLVQIKYLSDRAHTGRGPEIAAGNYTRRYRLKKQEKGLYTHQWNLPLNVFTTARNSIEFKLRDSLIFTIELCELHRVYDDIKEPNAFENEIRILEILDHFQPPPKGAILFTGSSTIRRWYDIENDLPGLNLINRGFGGSTMKDLNHYSGRIIFPHNPSKLFVYEGDNDIAGETTPPEFIGDCKELIQACSNYLPETDIYFIAIKPSPARWNNWKQMQIANGMLENLAGQHEKVHFIDITMDMLNEEGMPRRDIFVDDMLHLNDTGYEILANSITPFLY
jgi:lysophospholipase L1-like esterase